MRIQKIQPEPFDNDTIECMWNDWNKFELFILAGYYVIVTVEDVGKIAGYENPQIRKRVGFHFSVTVSLPWRSLCTSIFLRQFFCETFTHFNIEQISQSCSHENGRTFLRGLRNVLKNMFV